MKTKECKDCLEIKSVTEFSNNNKIKKNGERILLPRCRPCQNIYYKKYRDSKNNILDEMLYKFNLKCNTCTLKFKSNYSLDKLCVGCSTLMRIKKFIENKPIYNIWLED